MSEHKQFVLDCSMTMAWCFEDETTSLSEKIFDSLVDSEALVPAIWSLEVVNVLLMAHKRKRIDQVKCAAFMDRLAELPIRITNSKPISSMGSIFQLGMKRHLTSYDASYLSLALSHDLPLATLDKDLQKAARAVGIKLMK